MPPKAKFTKEEIITAAMKIVRREGVSALTARSLGAELNSSSAPIFTVFSGMDEVKFEVIASAKALYKRYIEDGLKGEIAFKGVGVSYIRFAKEEPKLFNMLFMTETGVADEVALLPALDENYDAILASITDNYALSAEVAAGLYMHMFIYSHGIATLCATGVYNFTNEQISEQLTQVFISLLKEAKR